MALGRLGNWWRSLFGGAANVRASASSAPALPPAAPGMPARVPLTDGYEGRMSRLRVTPDEQLQGVRPPWIPVGLDWRFEDVETVWKAAEIGNLEPLARFVEAMIAAGYAWFGEARANLLGHLDRAGTMDERYLRYAGLKVEDNSHISLHEKHRLIYDIHRGPAYEKEDLIAHGRPVFVELAPADPRSLVAEKTGPGAVEPVTLQLPPGLGLVPARHWPSIKAQSRFQQRLKAGQIQVVAGDEQPLAQGWARVSQADALAFAHR